MSIFEKIKWRLRNKPLSKVASQVLEARLTYLPVPRFLRLERAIRDTRSLPGDLLEFGVALGGSAIVLARAAKPPPRRFLGFDVFAMIPEPTSDKDDEKSRQRYQMIESGQAVGIDGDEYYGYRDNLYEQVSASFARYGVPVDGDRVQLVKGLFQESWPTVDVKAIALAHIDCDWYDPVRYCLEVCADKMLPGGQIIMDDYHTYGGCRTAVDEFLAARDDFRLEEGQNPILHKR